MGPTKTAKRISGCKFLNESFELISERFSFSLFFWIELLDCWMSLSPQRICGSLPFVGDDGSEDLRGHPQHFKMPQDACEFTTVSTWLARASSSQLPICSRFLFGSSGKLWRTLSWHHSSRYDFPQVMCLWLTPFTDGLCEMPWCSPLREVHIRRLWIAKFALRGRPDFQFFFHLFLCASSAEMWSLCTIAAYCSIPMTLLRHSTTRPGMKPHRWWWS